MEKIGLFQLENLILSRSPFLFFDLRRGDEPEPPEPLRRYLQAAKRLPLEELKSQLKTVDKSQPLLFVSQSEKPSAQVAEELMRAGFENVYIIAGGVDGLLSEL